ncbi:hypothetical protein JOD43_001425 [Pullulanibacillus pueri]|nr:hypothetical protein [Pullulanibacillus pueri]
MLRQYQVDWSGRRSGSFGNSNQRYFTSELRVVPRKLTTKQYE